MIMAFPGLDTLRPFLSDRTVGPRTRARYWLLYVESDVQTKQKLFKETQYRLNSTKRFAMTMFFVVIEWDCTFTRLKKAFGAPLLGKVVKDQYSFQKLNDFLRGARATDIDRWSTVFPTESNTFDQGLLGDFAMDLNIDSRDKLVALYCNLPKLSDPEYCRRMKVSITEYHAESLFREHYANSIAFIDL